MSSVFSIRAYSNTTRAGKGQWSIRINDQWRICFEWPEGSPGPATVEGCSG